MVIKAIGPTLDVPRLDGADYPALKAAPSTPKIESIDSHEKPKIEKSVSVWSKIVNWFNKLFGLSTEKAIEEPAAIPERRDKLLSQIEQNAKAENYRNELMQDDSLATDWGIDQAYLKALLAGIEIKKDQQILEEEQLHQVHTAIQAIQRQIEERMKSQMNHAKNWPSWEKSA